MRDNLLADIQEVLKQRPPADHSIEQYLMTDESVLKQIQCLDNWTENGNKVAFLGDDDHISVALSLLTKKIYCTIFEIDHRVIKSLDVFHNQHIDKTHTIIEHDMRNPLPKKYYGNFDVCVINPPYSSKNNGFGIRLWIKRALTLLKPNGLCVMTIPIQAALPWSYTNMLMVQSFLSENQCVIVDITKNLHTYYDLPDTGLMSSNITFQKTDLSHVPLPETKKHVMQRIYR